MTSETKDFTSEKTALTSETLKLILNLKSFIKCNLFPGFFRLLRNDIREDGINMNKKLGVLLIGGMLVLAACGEKEQPAGNEPVEEEDGDIRRSCGRRSSRGRSG